MDFTYDVNAGLSRSIRDAPPLHYKFRIESFSLFSEAETGTDRWESCIFEVDGQKWKLAIYPNGNKKRNVKRHISLYLVKAETSSLPHSWEVEAIFRFFVYDQIRDKYLTVQDLRSRRFQNMKTEYGFDRFISHEKFKDPSAGFLVDDTCLFGAEVFALNKLIPGKSECLTKLDKAVSCKHTRKIENFSKLEGKGHYSEVFTAGDYKWKILLYPKGYANDNNLSIFLSFDESVTLEIDHRVHVEQTLRVIDQKLGEHFEIKAHKWRSASCRSWGWPSFLSLSKLYDTSKGFLVMDCCIIEAEVKILGFIKIMP